jgi:hypothetical protein
MAGLFILDDRFRDGGQSLVTVAVQVLNKVHIAQLPTAGLIAQIAFHDFGADFAGDGCQFGCVCGVYENWGVLLNWYLICA